MKIALLHCPDPSGVQVRTVVVFRLISTQYSVQVLLGSFGSKSFWINLDFLCVCSSPYIFVGQKLSASF